MTLDQFVAKYDGKPITAPGGIGGQCVDLANEYILECFGYPHEWHNAIDWFGVDPARFDWVRNDPKNLAQIPLRGALMVWGPNSGVGTGLLGHIDVVLSAGPQSFVGFDQNWPIGAHAHHVVHSYAGVIGWGIPKPLLPAKPAPPAPAPIPTPPSPPSPGPVTPPAPVPPVTPPEAPPVQNPPAPPPVIVPDLPAGVVPPAIPEPPVVAEAGVDTSEWAALVRYGAQAAGLVTAQIVNAVSESVWHVGVVIPQSVQFFVGGLELAGAVAVAGYAISRGIRKLGTSG